MFERMLKLFSDDRDAVARRDQAQREALIDILVWTMFVDRHIASAETEQIRKETEGLPWEGVRSIERHISGAIKRVRDVLGSDQAEAAYLDDIHERLADEETRRHAVAACEVLTSADGERAEAEVAFLARIRDRFGLAEAS